MLNIVLLEPERPQNTGNIGRTCVVTGARLHLVRPFFFVIEDKKLKRAGMDYWDRLDYVIHDSYEEFLETATDGNIYYIETGGDRDYTEANYKDGDYLVFGPESRGIDPEILKKNRERILRVPMVPKERSLNLSNTVGIVLFEALRQLKFPGME